MVRPIVLVFQEFATLTATPTTPDLNCLITGPAYQIQDYPDDKADLQVSDYGTLAADNPYVPPVAFVPAITLAEAPNLVAGAFVDPDSIKVFFDDTRVIMESGTDGVSLLNDNLLTSASATFVTNGVRAGDVLIIDNPAGPATPNLILTISSIESETDLRVTTNFTMGAVGLNYRVERALDDQLIDSAFVVVPAENVSNEIEILGGVTILVDLIPRVVAYAKVYVGYRAFRKDLQGIDTVNNTAEILSKVGRIDVRNPLTVGLFVAKQNAGNVPIQFFGVPTQDLVGYNLVKDAISTDPSVYAVVPLITDTTVIASFKAEHETLADPNNALNTGIPQRFRVVIGSSDLPTAAVLVEETPTATSETLTGAIPPGIKRITLSSLTALSTNLRPGDRLILSASENVAPLDGTYTIAHINSETEVELNEVLPIAVAVAEGINYTVIRPSTTATIVPLVDNRAFLTTEDVTYTSLVAGVTPGTARTIAKVQDATTPGGIFSIIEVAGVSTIINADWATLTAADVVAAVNTGVGVTTPFTGSINVVASTIVPATLQGIFGPLALSTGTPGVDDLALAQTLDEVFVKLFDPAAAFITDGVLPGDYIEIPEVPNGVFTTTVRRFTVNQVLSEQRLLIKNVVGGFYVNNTSLVESELPHFDNRLGTGAQVTLATMRYHVIRQLSKDQQVTQLVSVSQSLNSRRALMVWPNLFTVSGLVDNSKAKNPDGSPASADPQPGYYGAAVVGGLTAGLPSHQGFSRLGIAGISKIKNSNDYFNEGQLTDLSDGGWYVFAQTTPISLPFCIHQLTTDPSTLQSGEYSIVKNFDFVSLFFLDILNPFIGIWNVNEDTMGFMRQAVNTGIDNLKLRRVARIGAPINDASITSLAISTASADRVELFMEVDLPVPLNVIGLHLVG